MTAVTASDPALGDKAPKPALGSGAISGSDLMNKRVIVVGLACLALLALALALNNLGVARGLHVLKPGVAEGGIGVAQAWAVNAGLAVIFMALVGYAIVGRPAGILIDVRNRISLSRLQAAGWSVLMLSALVTMAAARLIAGTRDALSIAIPPDLLIAMGISATSLAVAPALLSLKAVSPPPPNANAATVAANTGRATAAATPVGNRMGWATPADAHWIDIFAGEGQDDGDKVDLSKVQQFLVSLLLLTVYTVAIWKLFNGSAYLADKVAEGAKTAATLPEMSEPFVWFMGISHLGYLGAKALPK